MAVRLQEGCLRVLPLCGPLHQLPLVPDVDEIWSCDACFSLTGLFPEFMKMASLVEMTVIPSVHRTNWFTCSLHSTSCACLSL